MAPLKTVLFRDGDVSRVLKSSCIRPYTPVFRARLPCPHKKCLVFRGALNSKCLLFTSSILFSDYNLVKLLFLNTLELYALLPITFSFF